MKETWKDVPEFEGYYQVSNLGNIKGLSRKVSFGRSHRIVKENILKKYSRKRGGYQMVGLFKPGAPRNNRNKYVHRLVLSSFVGVVLDAEINHKNGIKTDNRLENLEWVTRKENIHHKLYLSGFTKYKNYKLKK